MDDFKTLNPPQPERNRQMPIWNISALRSPNSPMTADRRLATETPGSTARFDDYVPVGTCRYAGSCARFVCADPARLAVSFAAGQSHRTCGPRRNVSGQLLTALRESGPCARTLARATGPAMSLRCCQCPMIWCWGSTACPVVAGIRGRRARRQLAGRFLSRAGASRPPRSLVGPVGRSPGDRPAVAAAGVAFSPPAGVPAGAGMRRLGAGRGGEATDYAESLLQLVPQRSPAYALGSRYARRNAQTAIDARAGRPSDRPESGPPLDCRAGLFALAGTVATVALAQEHSAAAGSKIKTPATPASLSRPATESESPEARRGTSTNAQSEPSPFTDRFFTPDGRPAAGVEVFACLPPAM